MNFNDKLISLIFLEKEQTNKQAMARCFVLKNHHPEDQLELNSNHIDQHLTLIHEHNEKHHLQIQLLHIHHPQIHHSISLQHLPTCLLVHQQQLHFYYPITLPTIQIRIIHLHLHITFPMVQLPHPHHRLIH